MRIDFASKFVQKTIIVNPKL